jgi:hypothetical protein
MVREGEGALPFTLWRATWAGKALSRSTWALPGSPRGVREVAIIDKNDDIMERLDQGHLHPLLEHPETNALGWKSNPGCLRHSSKELFEQLT